MYSISIATPATADLTGATQEGEGFQFLAPAPDYLETVRSVTPARLITASFKTSVSSSRREKNRGTKKYPSGNFFSFQESQPGG